MFHVGTAAALLAVSLAVSGPPPLAPLRALAPCAPALHPRITEVFYDAAGDDTGREFVELWNSYDLPLPLMGARLEAGDGSGPGRWTLRWTGAAADTAPARGRFVIGGALVDAAPRATAALDLQNGPDAVRMVWPDGSIEVVGYGALEFAEYACGEPAPDVASGQSLARLPDDADLGSNALDFHAAVPSPGRPNQRRRDAALLRGASRASPELPAPGTPVRVAVVVENLGLDPFAASEVEVEAREAGASGALASRALPAALAAAETASVALELPPLPAGKHRLAMATALAGDEAPENDADSLWLRIGAGPLQLTEVQFHPAAGEGEWVEVRNAAPDPLDLAGFALEDRGDAPARLAEGARLAPESLAVLAQSRRALIARYPGIDSTRIFQASPWPSLNNSDDDAGVADVVRLLELDGTLTDRLAYSAAGVPAGVPLERDAAGVWSAAPQVGGTPLQPPAPRAAVAGRFEVEPRRVPIAGGGARLRWDLPWPRARVALDLYDLAGRPRGALLPETPVAGRGEHRWTPRDLAPGLYLVVLRARDTEGPGALAVTRPLRLEGP